MNLKISSGIFIRLQENNIAQKPPSLYKLQACEFFLEYMVAMWVLRPKLLIFKGIVSYYFIKKHLKLVSRSIYCHIFAICGTLIKMRNFVFRYLEIDSSLYFSLRTYMIRHIWYVIYKPFQWYFGFINKLCEHEKRS